MSTLLKGRDAAERLKPELRKRAAAVAEERGTAPRLAVLLVGGDGSSQVYLRSKLQACKDLGIESSVESLPEDAPEIEVLRVLKELAADAAVDGIMVEQPLPSGLDAHRIVESICPDKDVEGVTSGNLGRFYGAKSVREMRAAGALSPCTAEAVIQLLLETGVAPSGKDAVVIGRSGIVGRPAAHLLSCLDATVTLCHSRTRALEEHVRRADIVVAALGKRAFVKGSWIKPGAVVLDAGIHGSGKDLCGDVEFAPAAQVAGFITPVPGGVGPLTVTCLLQNVILSAERRVGVSERPPRP
ncbi:MAG: bifunctional 5,10-methylenetetrahydrofolate dehydrogenase/5,10-methenyltetrahydrofolate cyclohydrolase [Elusimicrobiota bacterium]|jgi:methylenetetrahydrofolate dehydrogenase (NADP+)/methenyltetrahydrofolate cyclohydrolase